MKTEEKTKDINEPAWLKEKRQLAWDNYINEPLPDRVSHLWKYSDPQWFEINTDSYKNNIASTKAEISFEIEPEAISKGVILGKTIDILLNKNTNNDFSKLFGSLASNKSNRLLLLNESLWSSGYCLLIPKGVKVTKPIISKIGLSPESKVEILRILIVMEEGSSTSLIEDIFSTDDSEHKTNIVTEVFLGSNAKLDYLNLQIQNKNTTHHVFQKALLESNSELVNLIVSLGGKTSKVDLGAVLKGENSSISTYGIVLGDGTQRFDHHTTLEHIGPHTKSELDFRVALKDKAQSAYTGNLKINHEAIKSSAHQENRNLLLSNDAKAESIPELEILTNDVLKCNHGVTVGRVDKDQIYYLMSRGLNEKEAERLIIEGFLEPTISRIPDENQKQEIELKVKLKLENL